MAYVIIDERTGEVVRDRFGRIVWAETAKFAHKVAEIYATAKHTTCLVLGGQELAALKEMAES